MVVILEPRCSLPTLSFSNPDAIGMKNPPSPILQLETCHLKLVAIDYRLPTID
jgi:hypothetical protein